MTARDRRRSGATILLSFRYFGECFCSANAPVGEVVPGCSCICVRLGVWSGVELAVCVCVCLLGGAIACCLLYTSPSPRD